MNIKGELRGSGRAYEAVTDKKVNKQMTAAQIEKALRGERPNREFRRFLKKLKREIAK